MSEQDDGPVPETRRPRRWLVPVLALTAVGAVLLIALVLGVAIRPASVAAEPRPTSTAPSTTSSSAPSAPPTSTAPSPTADADPAALADLHAVAATLTTPLALTSPTSWDRWLPEGKPYPGSSLEEEISTCPQLAARLTAALGQKMSYWTGTLPGGPYGCTWVPVPLVYDSPDYDYVIAVGFLADGTTPVSLARRNATADGPCPWQELPELAPGAVLVRCAPGNATEYTLALMDTRLPGGLWTLVVDVKDRAAVPASRVLPVLIEGAVAAFG
jgi:hypothetical protein